jgi:hypothetical protein
MSYANDWRIKQEFARNGVQLVSDKHGKIAKRRRFLGAEGENNAPNKTKKATKPHISNGICQKCGLKAQWLQSGGRWVISNMDGSEHYDACSEKRSDGKRRKPLLIGITGQDNKIIPFDGLPWD